MSLKSYLAEIADAIRAKKGTTDPINAQDFATEIASIEGGGSAEVEIIDVDSLPTKEAMYIYKDGVRLTELTLIESELDPGDLKTGPYSINIVGTLPEPANGVIHWDGSRYTLYYQKSDGRVYTLNEKDGVKTWTDFDDSALGYLLAFGILTTNDFIITSPSQAVPPENSKVNAWFLYEPINEKVIYRTPVKAPDEVYLYIGALGGRQDYMEGLPLNWIVVDTLPSVGEPFADNFDAPTKVNLYYQKSDSLGYVYIPPEMDGPGWVELSQLDYQYTVITSEDQATDENTLYLVYKEGYELSLTETAYTYFNGKKDDLGGIPVSVNIVDALPEVGEGVADNLETPSYIAFYYQRKDNQAYGYIPEGFMEGSDVSGWFTASLLVAEFASLNFAIVSTEAEATDSATFYLIYQSGACRLYYYDNGWKGMGTTVATSDVSGTPAIGTWTSTSTYPTTASVSNLYFNTSLSIGEVVATLSSLDYSSGVLGAILAAAAPINSSGLVAQIAILYTQGIATIQDGVSGTLLFTSVQQDSYSFVGWNPDFTGIIPVNGELCAPFVEVSPPSGGIVLPVDNQQAKYANLISLTPFEAGEPKPLAGSFDGSSITVTQNGTVDIESMLDEQKLPLKVNVNIDTSIPDDYVNLNKCSTFVIETTDSDTTFTLNLRDKKAWGDGSIGNEINHNYSSPGVYTIVYGGGNGDGCLFGTNWDVAPAGISPHLLYTAALSNNITSLGYCAFYGCSKLKSIIISDSVTYIGQQAFQGCRNLTNIIYIGTKAQWKSIRFGTDWNQNTGDYIITCTDGTIAKDGTET